MQPKKQKQTHVSETSERGDHINEERKRQNKRRKDHQCGRKCNAQRKVSAPRVEHAPKLPYPVPYQASVPAKSLPNQPCPGRRDIRKSPCMWREDHSPSSQSDLRCYV